MSVSPVDIANRAIQRLGSTRYIAALDENSANAHTMNTAYDIIRRRLLRTYPWNFAKARASIAADAVKTIYGTLNRFGLPNDFLRLIRPSDNTKDWEIEGRFITTADAGPLQFQYIFDETNSANFDVLFVEAFSCLLSYETCEQVPGSTDKRRLLQADFKEVMQTARTENAFERESDLPPMDDYILAMLPGNMITPG